MAEPTIGPKPVGAYVYVILVDGIERYVGKGRARRAWDHVRDAKANAERRARGERPALTRARSELATAMAAGSTVEVFIIVEGLSDEQAFEREVAEIASKPAGQLWNHHPGGSGGTPARVRETWNEERRCAAAQFASGQWLAHPERRARQSDWARQLNEKLWADGSDFRATQSQRVQAEATTPEGRAAMSERASGMWTDEFRAKRSSETSRQMDERWSDPEQRRRASERMKARWAAPDSREKFAAAMAKKKQCSG